MEGWRVIFSTGGLWTYSKIWFVANLPNCLTFKNNNHSIFRINIDNYVKYMELRELNNRWYIYVHLTNHTFFGHKNWKVWTMQISRRFNKSTQSFKTPNETACLWNFGNQWNLLLDFPNIKYSDKGVEIPSKVSYRPCTI